MSKIKAIILDCDGVILSSNGAFLKLYEQLCKKHGVKEKPHDIYRYFGESPKKILQTIFKQKNVNALYKEYTASMKEGNFLKKLKPYKGVKTSLNRLTKNYKICVASGGVSKRVKESLRASGLLKYFIFVIAGDDVKQGKPHPEMLHKCMKKMHVKHEETIYVGDAPSDILAAKNAGIKSVAVLTGVLDKKTAKRMKADYIISDLPKLETLLKKLKKDF